jgi:hypothetical protein
MRAPEVVARTVAGETLLVPVRRGVALCDRIFILNRTAAFLWLLLDGTRDRTELATRVRDEFEVPGDVDLSGDVARLIADLDQRGLLARDAT